jgi:RHS repeat-associated protein
LDSGLVYARARYLSASVGAFMSADPLGGPTMPASSRVMLIAAEGPNLYSYVRSAPTIASDPSGMWCRLSGPGLSGTTFNGWPAGNPIVPHLFAPGFCSYNGPIHTNGYLDLTFHRAGAPARGRWGPHINYKVHPAIPTGYAKKPTSNLHSGIIWRDDGQICYRHGYTGTAMGNTQVDHFCVSSTSVLAVVVIVVVVAAVVFFLPEMMAGLAAEGALAGAAAMLALIPTLASADGGVSRNGGCGGGKPGEPPADGDDDE